MIDDELLMIDVDLVKVIKESAKSKNNRLIIADGDSAEIINIVTGSNLSIEQGKESIDMCQAIEEMRAESEAKGILKTLVNLFKKGILTLAQAAEEAQMSPEEFQRIAAAQQ